MPAPKYVAKSIIPLTDATFPVCRKFIGKMESIEVLMSETEAYIKPRQMTETVGDIIPLMQSGTEETAHSRKNQKDTLFSCSLQSL